MALFSQRQGIRAVTKLVQRESMDDELRNRLWNALQTQIWVYWRSGTASQTVRNNERVEFIVRECWLDFFKLPIDQMKGTPPNLNGQDYTFIRNSFFESEWWRVYDFIEFILKTRSISQWKASLSNVLNRYLEDENAAYRIVESEVIEITDTNEINAIEDALRDGPTACREHLLTAMQLISDRQSPDYRNSIKESISAVESVCQYLTGNSKATLGECLKQIKDKKPLHPAFEQALSKLYGYTSDGAGIRHALDGTGVLVSYADAKFMLVSCSAFSNYLLTKAAELGVVST